MKKRQAGIRKSDSKKVYRGLLNELNGRPQKPKPSGKPKKN